MNRTVSRLEPSRGIRDDVCFVIRRINPEEADAAAARLRMQFPGADVQVDADGKTINMLRGDYGFDWRHLTETQVAQVVQDEGPLLHIVLAPDPTFIDAIQMRVNVELGDEQTRALYALGLMVHCMDESSTYDALYRLTPRVGNPWPSRGEIARALDAKHTQPMNAEVW